LLVILNSVLGGICLLGSGELLIHADKYSRSVRIAFTPAMAAVGVALLANLLWPVRIALLAAAAGLCLAMDVVIALSPSAGWPRSYIWSLKIGWGVTFLGFCLLIGRRLGLLPWSDAFLLTAGAVALVGVAVSGIGYVFLRPKGRPWNNGVL